MKNVSDAGKPQFGEDVATEWLLGSDGAMSLRMGRASAGQGRSGEPALGKAADHYVRRLHFITAAIDLWGACGYSHVTISGLAERTGVTYGSMRSCFANRDELVQECVRVARERIGLDKSGYVAAAHDANQLVETFIDDVCTSMRVHASLHRIRYDLLSQSMFDEGLVADAQSIHAAWMSGISGFAERLHALGGSGSDAVVTTRVIEDLFARTMHRHTVDSADAARLLAADLRAYVEHLLGRTADESI
ncbi:TetR/AcrR family transcriptional regulator [Rudaeicoccus suwonensis]|uniref:TetR/AcrR family transcriptional regulator n=1 Tax=Rudaeicoccus suwonensis TaxID=657409 RepID=UPI0011A5C7E6|nr:TetR/AcrR family transcriptional regulator [Rudaeicoccus suwonensis]